MAAAYPTFGGNHGFDLTQPVTPGPHEVCLFAINVGRGSTKALGCRTVWVAGEGITGGYANGTFRPGTAVSRQAMAAFLHRLALWPPS